MSGVLEFDTQWMRAQPYLDGVAIDFFDPEYSPTWQEDSGGAILLPTHAGTHRMQSIYLGESRALDFSPQTFNFGCLIATEEDAFRIERAKRRGRRVVFAPWIWVEEVFAATDGQTYTLTRPVAYGIDADVTAISYPVKAFLDDVSSDASITLAGGSLPQTFTAEDTGEIAVRYPPAFRMRISSLQRVMKTVNGLVYTVSLEEAVSV